MPPCSEEPFVEAMAEACGSRVRWESGESEAGASRQGGERRESWEVQKRTTRASDAKLAPSGLARAGHVGKSRGPPEQASDSSEPSPRVQSSQLLSRKVTAPLRVKQRAELSSHNEAEEPKRGAQETGSGGIRRWPTTCVALTMPRLAGVASLRNERRYRDWARQGGGRDGRATETACEAGRRH